MVREYANMYIFQDSKALSQPHTFPLTCREMLRNVIILKKKIKIINFENQVCSFLSSQQKSSIHFTNKSQKGSTKHDAVHLRHLFFS